MLLKLTVLSLFSLTACKDVASKKSSPASAIEKPSAMTDNATQPAPPTSGPTPLHGELSWLTIDLPEGARLHHLGRPYDPSKKDAFLVAGYPNDFDSFSELEAQIKELETMYSATIESKEKLENGWRLRYNVKDEHGGIKYETRATLTFGDVTINCNSASPLQAQRDIAYEAWKTIKKK